VASADLVVVENLCSLPLNPVASTAVARALAGRPALMRHHDLPWQRAAFADAPAPPDDPAWCHVTTTDQSRRELRARGIDAVTVPNMFDPYPPRGDRNATREALGVEPDKLLVVQPTRAIARKGIDRALALAEALGASYWLVGKAEEGFGPTVEGLLANAKGAVRWGLVTGMTATTGIEHAYAAADLVAFPSAVEGFGNPPVEASLQRRPVAVGPYPVAAELRAMGFRWFDALAPGPIEQWLHHGDEDILEHNLSVARQRLNLNDLPARLAALMGTVGVPCPSPPGLS
jgi:glycosyltransferase involved in cell wall biosynthesis